VKTDSGDLSEVCNDLRKRRKLNMFLNSNLCEANVLKFSTILIPVQQCTIKKTDKFPEKEDTVYNNGSVRYHAERSMKLNARILLFAHMIYL
jgi:hypothetical protein